MAKDKAFCGGASPRASGLNNEFHKYFDKMLLLLLGRQFQNAPSRFSVVSQLAATATIIIFLYLKSVFLGFRINWILTGL